MVISHTLNICRREFVFGAHRVYEYESGRESISAEVTLFLAPTVGVKTGGSRVGGPDLCVLG